MSPNTPPDHEKDPIIKTHQEPEITEALPRRFVAFVKQHRQKIEDICFDAACVVTPIFLFLCFFTPQVLDPTNIGWLFWHDWGQHVLGFHALRNVPWSWAFYYQNLLAYPTGLSIIYTDSNPPLAYLFKLLSPLLPKNFQYIGPWFFLCVLLHVYTAYRLIRPFAPSRWLSLLGTIVLSVLPALYYRMRHDTLMAHWLILWALYIFIHIKDEKARRNYFALNNFLTGMIHPYLLVMTAAIWSADVIRSLWPLRAQFDAKRLLVIVRDAMIVLAAPLIGMGLVGTYASGQSAGAGGFGYFSMGLDAPFNPVEPKFSTIMKAWYQDAGQAFEGYQYLGFGLLCLLAVSALLWWLRPEVRSAKPFIKSLWPLLLPMIGLLLLALSNNMQIYNMTFLKFSLPEPIMGVMAILRASGRFFWPISYLFLLIALVVLYQMPKKTTVTLLVIALSIQAFDLWHFSAEMRKTTMAAASKVMYRLTPDKRWDEIYQHAKQVRFYPAQAHHNQALFYELTWRAVSLSKPVNTMYAARENIKQISIENAEQDRFLKGEISRDTLYVFLKQCYAPPIVQDKLKELDGVWILPPEGVGNLPLNQAQWKPIKPVIRFGWIDQGGCLLDENWTRPGYDGAWTTASSAGLRLPLGQVRFDDEVVKNLTLKMNFEALQATEVKIIINKRAITTLKLAPRASEYEIELPRSLSRAKELDIDFVLDPGSNPNPQNAAVKGGRPLEDKQTERAARLGAGAPSPIKLKRLELINNKSFRHNGA